MAEWLCKISVWKWSSLKAEMSEPLREKTIERKQIEPRSASRLLKGMLTVNSGPIHFVIA
jgi:hypothetical protein